MAISRIPSPLLPFIFIFYSSVVIKSVGFSSKLYHRDFPGSPLFDPTLSLTERVSKAVDRSIAHHRRSAIETPISLKADVKFNDNDYMMKIALGSPPVEYFVVIDITSDLTWIECVPCQKCMVHAPHFDPSKSSTYRKIGCTAQDHPCLGFLGDVACKNDVCTYALSYRYGTRMAGDISADVLTLDTIAGQQIVQSNYSFGCGNNNEGFVSRGASGVIGLGRDVPQSFMTQLYHFTQGKFSYCFASVLSGGKGLSTINFGQNSTLTQPGVVSTPLSKLSDGTGSGYYALLEALTIGGERIEFTIKAKLGSNIMINSATTLSRFPTGFYNKILDTFIKHVNARSVIDPTGRLDLCYYDTFGLDIPDVTANFAGGAVIYLNRDNLFVRGADGIICLAIVEGEDVFGYGVWGNAAQINFFVGFDIEAGTLSFMPTLDCSKDG